MNWKPTLTLLMFLLTIASALAVETITTGETLTSTATSTAPLGVKFYTHSAVELLNATKLTGTNATIATLYTAANVSLFNATFSGNQAQFNYILSKDTYYYLKYHDNGATYRYNASAAASYPYTGTYITIVNGSTSTGDADTNVWNVESFTITPLNNLQAYYNFSYYDYLFDQSKVIDLSDFENNGTLTSFNFNPGTVSGATWNSTGGPFGDGAYEFDGSNDWINTTFVMKTTHAGTICFWADITDTSPKTIIGYYTNASSYFLFQARTATQFRLGIDGTNYDVSGIDYTSYQYDCAVWTGSQFAVYADGVQLGVNTSYTADVNFHELRIGTSGLGDYLGMNLTKIQYWNSSLTPIKIRQAMYNTSPIHQPVGAWIFPSPYNNDTYVPDVHQVTESTTTPGGVDLEEAISFDGVNDIVTFNIQEFEENDSYTISFYAIAYDDDTMVPIAHTASTVNDIIFQNAGRLYLEGIVNNNVCYGSISYQDNQWHHYALVVSNSVCQFYEDGTAITMTDNTMTAPINLSRLGAALTSNPFNGSIDEVKLLSEAWTSYDVADEYYYADADYSKIFASITSPSNQTQTTTTNLTITYEVNFTDGTDDPDCSIYRGTTLLHTNPITANGTYNTHDDTLTSATHSRYEYYLICNNSGNITQTSNTSVFISNTYNPLSIYYNTRLGLPYGYNHSLILYNTQSGDNHTLTVTSANAYTMETNVTSDWGSADNDSTTTYTQTFEFHPEDLASGEHYMTIRACDGVWALFRCTNYTFTWYKPNISIQQLSYPVEGATYELEVNVTFNNSWVNTSRVYIYMNYTTLMSAQEAPTTQWSDGDMRHYSYKYNYSFALFDGYTNEYNISYKVDFNNYYIWNTVCAGCPGWRFMLMDTAAAVYSAYAPRFYYNTTLYGVVLGACSGLVNTTVYNFVIVNESSRADITADVEGYALVYPDRIASPSLYLNFTFAWIATHNYTLCMYPANASLSVDLYLYHRNVSYRMENWIRRWLTPAVKAVNYTIYMLTDNDMDYDVLFTLQDYTSQIYQNYLVLALQKNTSAPDTYTIVESEESDLNGQVVMALDIYEKFYIFQVYDTYGDLVYQSIPQQVVSTENVLIIALADSQSWLQNYIKAASGTKELSEAASVVTLDYNLSYSDYVCLATTVTNASGITRSYNCSSSTSGTLSYTMLENQTITAEAISEYNGRNYSIVQQYFSTLSENADTRDFKLFLAFVIMVACAVMAAYSPPIAVITMVLGLIVVNVFKLIPFDKSAIMGFIIAAVTLLAVLYKRKVEK